MSNALSATLEVRRCSPFLTFILAVTISAFASSAHASFVISSAPTSNVSCTSNSCNQSGSGAAVLNVSQLQTLLASSSVTVTAKNSLDIGSEITWASSSKLTLSAGGTITINKPIVVTGEGGLGLTTEFSFAKKGKITFWSTSSAFTFGPSNAAFTLVNSVAMLASAIATNPNGNYALANDYDASGDGTYTSSPIPNFSGNFFGLNNTISNLSISDPVAGQQVGLFGEYVSTEFDESETSIVWLHLHKVRISGAENSQVGSIVGVSRGDIAFVSVDGSVATNKTTGTTSPGAIAGGIVGLNYAGISNSYSTGSVKGGKNAILGGIAGEDGHSGDLEGGLGAVYSTMTVTLDNGACPHCGVGLPDNSAGGLVGVNYGSVVGSYATGAVSGGSFANLGGLIGLEDIAASVGDYAVEGCYSTGAVTGGAGSSVGGSIGYDETPGYIINVYWDTTTSGITSSSQGSGNITNDSGISGLTSAQLQSGLPPGFSPEDWGENANINGGFPYLLSLLPS